MIRSVFFISMGLPRLRMEVLTKYRRLKRPNPQAHEDKIRLGVGELPSPLVAGH
jgi:hypothetical protein